MRLYQIDAFASQAFRGNPAAVCLLDGARDEGWMQSVAAEMNLSETAFVAGEGDDYRLRWFTPAAEVALCGHATLASAHALWEERGISSARFHTKSGVLTTRRGDDGWIELDFPATPAEAAGAPEGLLEALGVPTANYVGRSRFDYLIEIPSDLDVMHIAPDFPRLRALPVRGIIVTSRAQTRGYDFVSRFFAPGVGIDEDPVTGSAHCALTPYWAAKLGKTEMRALQCSRRGGEMHVRLDGARVKMRGAAVTVLRGELVV